MRHHRTMFHLLNMLVQIGCAIRADEFVDGRLSTSMVQPSSAVLAMRALPCQQLEQQEGPHQPLLESAPWCPQSLLLLGMHSVRTSLR